MVKIYKHMNVSELFRESIADAKAVRASALANAKASLEEAFTPRLQSMLGAKLREELDDEEMATPATKDNVPPDDADEISSDEIDAILKELDGEENSDVSTAAPSVPGNDVPAPSVDTPPVADTTTPPAGVKTVEAPVMVVAPGTAPVAPTVSEPSVPSPDSTSPAAPVDAAAPSEDEDINLEELLSSLREESSDSTTIAENDSEKEKSDEKEKEKCDVDEQLSEACKTIEFLRGQLNEVNLLNAKLLYTNKLFKAHALDDKQKMKIIESFDLAKSIREVKLTFNNLSEAMNFSKVGVAPKRSTIAEGLSSKSIGTTKPAATTIVQAPVNEMANRFQKLAGIKAKKQ